MNRMWFLAAAALIAAPAVAQNVPSFTIGPRYSNYSTRIETISPPVETGRQNAVGVVGTYRTGAFVLDFQYDYDPQNGVSAANLVGFDVGDYSRDRGEVTVGASPVRGLDLMAGARFETVRVGGARIFGTNVGTDLDLDHQAIIVGARVGDTAVSAARPVGFYAMARGYIGSAKYDRLGVHVNSDTSGYRGEIGVPVALGESTWSIVPGIEYEQIKTKESDVKWRTNRFFINFLYSFRR